MRNLIELSPEAAHAALRGLVTAARADGELHNLERRFLGACQDHLFGSTFDISKLAAISGAELAEHVPEEHRAAVLDAMVVTALIDGKASSAESEVLEEFADALGADSAVRDFSRAVDQHFRMLRIALLRRSFIGQRVARYVRENRVRGLLSMAQSLRDKEQPELAAKYRALLEYPEGTLGRCFADFIRQNEFSFPGEVHGPPEPIIFHDCLHVLGEYGTDPVEETQAAAFQAGMLRKDSVFGLFFMLAQFHLGVQITPVAEAYTDVLSPEIALTAFVRGTQVNRDLCVDWDPWEDMDKSITELRKTYNIVPREA